MSLDQDLLSLKSKGEQLNNLRVINQTKLQGLEQEKEKLLVEAQELGVAPDKIEEILLAEEAALQAEATKIGSELTRVLDEISRI